MLIFYLENKNQWKQDNEKFLVSPEIYLASSGKSRVIFFILSLPDNGGRISGEILYLF